MASGFGFEIRGIDDLKRAFAALPQDLADEASQLALTHAQAAESAIQPTYAAHVRTGLLARSLAVTTQALGRFSRAALVQVRRPAWHARLIESGTRDRKTQRGWNRGSSQGHPTFAPAVSREREGFDQDLENLLRRAGLDVRRG